MALPTKQVKYHEIAELDTFYNGGKGSGNFGHSGRPGKVGGSGNGQGGSKSARELYAEKYPDDPQLKDIPKKPLDELSPKDIENLDAQVRDRLSDMKLGRVLSKEQVDAAENLGWRVDEDFDDTLVEFAQGTPAGEDFSFTVSKDNIAHEVAQYAADFDEDEHIEMWLEAKRTGVAGVPSARVLVQDAKEIQEMLYALADELNKKK